jgi:hypothetical protein
MQCAQLIHAAGESSPGNLPANTFAIALHARDRHHLAEISIKLLKAKIPHNRIFETDHPYDGQLMAIGIPPMPRRKLKRLLSSLPLVK